ncbi:diguanylate cyclase [Methylomonas sp. Kb3]|uniref:putative bifunctional diguanylate cyclase/phosphodiesterase n=1 Tax=Methylomonas sp. Kb3 TaxID=1611544 RepID=UPI000C31C5D1|nr:GGDEF and EAL domain-containing protein [Methylomonas sp. Kb3]PKD41153.1 diguanylate cyclase [Methylomonas sp. Kb3]
MKTPFFDFFSAGGLMPHGFCLKWTPGLLWSYVISDALIALAYFAIAVILAYVVSQRRDLKFRGIYLMFSSFILACGASHLMSIFLIWQPLYWLDTAIKALTATISLAAAILLVKLVPHALKLPSNRQLAAEIAVRTQAQQDLQESESKLKALSQQLISLIEAIPDAILFKDGDGRLLFANEHAQQLFRFDGMDWQGKTYLELADQQPDTLDKHIKLFSDEEAVWKAGHLIMFEDHILNDEGRLIEIEVRKTPIYQENGQRKGMVVISRDISNIRWAESQLRIAERAIESQEGIMITDENNIILRVNNAFTRLTGYQPDEVIGNKPSILKSGRHGQEFYREMWAALKREKFWQGEVWDRRKNGDVYPKWLTISVVTGADGHTCNYVAAFTDISQHKEAQAAIHRLAYYDPLTDLPNRRLLQDRLQQALHNSRCVGKHGAVLMIDVDNFKTINDTQGHQIGDQLLIEIASRLKSCVRQGDTVARLGGDEFIVLLENLGSAQAEATANAEDVAHKILCAINTGMLLNGKEHLGSISIGIAIFDEHNNSFDDTLRRADAALYQAKDAGRNTLRFFDPQMQALLESRVLLEFDLRHAQAQDQLSLHYQPQVDKNAQIFGAEVLLRWKHPQKGMISPAEFIPLAEESGLILPIGEWVLQCACEQLKAWEQNPLTQHLQLAVNVSARQFRQADFVESICRILNNSGANSAKLKLELTESMVLHDVEDAIEKMQTLKSLGVRFSMDDFGTGYSSLSYLKKLPLSQLKIDQSFVRDLIVDPNDAVIAQTIIGMGHNLGLNVIAEGVETQDQRICLERIGCDAFQGYLFGKPMPLPEFERVIHSLNRAIRPENIRNGS